MKFTLHHMKHAPCFVPNGWDSQGDLVGWRGVVDPVPFAVVEAESRSAAVRAVNGRRDEVRARKAK